MQVSVYTYAIACGNMHSHIFTETALCGEVHVLSQGQNRFSTICELACNWVMYMYIGMYIQYVGVCVVCVRVHVCV